jgi:hypothetical protein
MTRNFQSQKGFAAIQALLVLVIVIMVGGVGYYVWQSQKQVDKTYSQTANSSVAPSKKNQLNPTPVANANLKYFVIKEWGVRAPYDNSDTLTYRVAPGNGNSIEVISKNLADKYGCTDYGAGIVARLAPTDKVGPTDTTVEQAAQAQADQYKKVGNYYFTFEHDQAACGNINADTTASDVQNTANNYTKSLVSKLEPVQ